MLRQVAGDFPVSHPAVVLYASTADGTTRNAHAEQDNIEASNHARAGRCDLVTARKVALPAISVTAACGPWPRRTPSLRSATLRVSAAPRCL